MRDLSRHNHSVTAVAWDPSTSASKKKDFWPANTQALRAVSRARRKGRRLMFVTPHDLVDAGKKDTRKIVCLRRVSSLAIWKPCARSGTTI